MSVKKEEKSCSGRRDCPLRKGPFVFAEDKEASLMRGLPGGPGERTGPVPCPFVCTHSSFFPSFFQAGLRTSPILREKRISQTVYPLQISIPVNPLLQIVSQRETDSGPEPERMFPVLEKTDDQASGVHQFRKKGKNQIIVGFLSVRVFAMEKPDRFPGV